jgi:hypothetical protein
MSKFYPTFNDLKTPDNTERTVKKVYDFLYELTDKATTHSDQIEKNATTAAESTANVATSIQLETSVAAAATDPATTMALVNELRAALIAAKICK